MQFRIPALDAVTCPKCGSGNIGRKVYIWDTVDERGRYFDCDVCAVPFPYYVADLNQPPPVDHGG